MYKWQEIVHRVTICHDGAKFANLIYQHNWPSTKKIPENYKKNAGDVIGWSIAFRKHPSIIFPMMCNFTCCCSLILTGQPIRHRQ